MAEENESVSIKEEVSIVNITIIHGTSYLGLSIVKRFPNSAQWRLHNLVKFSSLYV
jgi:hypothetical protein